jgi:transcriptional regulator with XRE-family HTH domain
MDDRGNGILPWIYRPVKIFFDHLSILGLTKIYSEYKLGGMKHGIQTELAKRTGLSVSMVNKLLLGQRRPSWETAKRLAKATGTKPILWMEGTAAQLRAAIESG